MNRLHIIGRKDSGKTTLIVDLVRHFSSLGYRVGTIKHTHHRHELDTPNKDSHRHRTAGAIMAGILSRSMNAVFWPNDAESACAAIDRYEQFSFLFAACDIVLVEGDSRSDAPKIEVWRAELATPPIASTDMSILAVITDDSVDVAREVLPRSDVAGLAQWILSHVLEKESE